MSTRIRVHPGGFLKRNYVDELNLKQTLLADALEVHRGTLSRLLREEIDMSPEMAYKVSKVLGGSAESWMRMQVNHNLSKLAARREYAQWKPQGILKDGVLVMRKTAKKPVRAKKVEAA
jgi:addiction module HigA family antidote